MLPHRPLQRYDSVDEVPLDELPVYGDPERTDPLVSPQARSLVPELEDWLGDEPPSLVPTPEELPYLTRPMDRPIWDRSEDQSTGSPLIEPSTLMVWGAAGVLAGMTAVLSATVLALILGWI